MASILQISQFVLYTFIPKFFFNFRNKSAICSMVCQDLVTFSLVKVELRVVCFMACMNISYYLAVWLYLDWFYWFPVDTLLF